MAAAHLPWGAFVLLAASVPATVGARGELAPLPPCPPTPNCVSTEAPPDDAMHHLPPLPLPPGVTPEAALDAFEALVRAAPRTEVVDRSPLRLRATQRSRVFRFVDDVEARVDPEARVLHARSASQVGRGDLGVNRRRVSEWFASLAATWGVAWTEGR